MPRLTRRTLIAAAAPVVAAGPLAKLALADQQAEHLATHLGHDHAHAATGHAAMIGENVPAVGGPHDLDRLLHPPAPLPYRPGACASTRSARSTARSRSRPACSSRLDVQRDRPARPPRNREEDRPRFANGGSHPHTIHFHGSIPRTWTEFEIVEPGSSFDYEFEARPAGFHPYHCHATPLKKHIHKGLYGALIIDLKEPRPPAQDRDGDERLRHRRRRREQLLHRERPVVLLRAVPDQVSRSKLVRLYLANLTEFDLLNLVPPARGLLPLPAERDGEAWEYTDTAMQCQGQRGVIEISFANEGLFMFHAHQSEFTELGWMGYFNVVA